MADPRPPAANPLHLDLRVVAEGLRGGQATDAWMASWLEATYHDDGRFRAAMYAHLGSRREAVFKSRPGAEHDLYHDLVAVHVGRRRTALSARGLEGVERTSYDALHARCNALAALWREQGLEPGQALAIVAPAGVEQAAALLTAFRLGLIASPLPPLGPGFVQRSIERLAPDRIAAHPSSRSMLGPLASSALPVDAGARTTAPGAPHAYGPGEPALRLLAPYGPSEEGVAEVAAETVLDGCVRDASFAYALGPGDVIAAPGFDAIRFGPSLLLAALSAGACHALATEAELDAEPQLLAQLQITVLGLSRRGRDRLMRLRSGMPGSVRAWFRSLSDVLDGNRWDDFWRTVPDRKQPGFSLVVGAAAGGAVLFSAPSPQPPSLRVFPAPGLSWRLSELAAEQVPALNDAGAFTLLSGEEVVGACPQAVVGRWGEGYAYAGSLDLGPGAMRYPHDDVERAAERVPGVRHASSFLAPGRWLNEAKVVLVAFVAGGEAGERPEVDLGALEAAVKREMGEGFSPDRVEIVPLRPRLRDGAVDRSWVRSQYMTGVLGRKARSELFVRIGRLGYIFAPPRGAK